MKDLLPHQSKALKQSNNLFVSGHHGMILFHALGSGKTMTSLGIIKYFLKFNAIKKVYIVCPRYLFTVWKNEIEDQKITNVTLLDINDSTTFTGKYSKKNLCIIDEAHLLLSNYLRRDDNISIDEQRQVYEFFNQFKFSIFATATPIYSNITDLYIWENLCSKNAREYLPTNDKNIFPDYYKIDYPSYIIFNRLYPVLFNIFLSSVMYMSISIMKNIIQIVDDTFRSGSFKDDKAFFLNVIDKFQDDAIGRQFFLPQVYAFRHHIFGKENKEKLIDDDNEIIDTAFNNKQITCKKGKFHHENNIIYKLFTKICEILEIQKDPDKYRKKITKIAYAVKLADLIIYSILIVFRDIRNSFLKTKGVTTLNYNKFISKLQSFDKYQISEDNKDFPTSTKTTIEITLNEKQTKKMVSAIVNKSYFQNCETEAENEILCQLYNIRYNDIPMKRILQISNKYDTPKLIELMRVINEYRTRIVISVRYNDSLSLLELFFKEMKLKFRSLYPASSEENEILSDFRQNKFDILLLHPEIIEGITVHNTQALVIFDVCTKYYVQQQVIGRCIRYKSHDTDVKSNVDIIHFVTIFDPKLLLYYMKQYPNPDKSSEENLRDASKYKFLTTFKSCDEFFTDLNNIISNLYKKL